mmetsp:Transcript_20716/g.34193  ORF Transcript_20716/g.34193 Transcript_20716/m.34193 type:complete len:244 (+) Transcript_20716:33-764(+)
MFIVKDMKDTIRIPPSSFNENKRDTLVRLIDEKYCNTVVMNVGMVVCLYDVLVVGDSYVYPGDGASHTECEFSVIVFKPAIGEVLEGTINLCCQEFIRISLGFFQDIYVDRMHMRKGMSFHRENHWWEWKYTDDETESEASYYVTTDSKIRVKVEQVLFMAPHVTEEAKALRDAVAKVSSSSKGTDALNGTRNRSMSTSSVLTAVEEANILRNSKTKGPMLVLVTINDDGLGPVEWWDQSEES